MHNDENPFTPAAAVSWLFWSAGESHRHLLRKRGRVAASDESVQERGEGPDPLKDVGPRHNAAECGTQ
jgi:hypothetical protein